MLLVGFAAPRQAQNYKLSEPPHSLDARVQSFALAGGRVVFDTLGFTGIPSLRAAADDGTPPWLVLHDVDINGRLEDFQIAPDGSWVVYKASIGSLNGLRTVPADGSLPSRVMASVMAGPIGVSTYQITPDSTRVVYLAQHDGTGFELYSRPIDLSGPRVRLDPAFQGTITHFRVSPDGQWVVYRSDREVSSRFDLYSVSVDGSGPPRRLNETTALADVEPDFTIGFDSQGVIYRSDELLNDVIELWAARIDGSGPTVKRSAPLVVGGDVLDFRLSPSSDELVYRADLLTDDVIELFATRAITGDVPRKLNGSLTPGGDVSADYQLDPTNGYVLYRADQDTDNVVELYSAAFEGAQTSIRLHPPLPTGRATGLVTPAPDGEHVVFTMDLERPRAKELWRARLDGVGAPQRLSMELDPDHEVSSVVFLAGGARLAFVADDRGDGRRELFGVPLDGSLSPRRLSGHIPVHGSVGAIGASADGQRVVFSGNQLSADEPELFTVPVQGGVAPRRLHAPFRERAGAYDVVDFRLLSDDEVAYTSFDGDVEELRVGIDRSAPTRSLTVVVDEFLTEVSPDAGWLLFTRAASNSEDLVSRRADGSGAANVLDAGLPNSGSDAHVLSTLIDAASQRVVFTTGREVESSPRLYGAPLDGSAPAVRLDSLVAVDIDSPRFALGGAWVVFLSAPPSGPRELYAVPSDGSAPAVRLNAPLPPGGGIGGYVPDSEYQSTLFVVTPDGTRVVYAAEQETDDRTELFSVPADGSGPPVKLNQSLQPDGDLRIGSFAGVPFHVTPDGASVLYVADAETDETFELYRAPVLGGAAPVKLSGTVVPGCAVGGKAENSYFVRSGKELSPDGTWYVYTADADTLGVNELYAVRVDGSAPPVRLNVPYPADKDVRDFLVSPTSDRVLFRSSSSFLSDLDAAPIDGSAPAVRLGQRVESWDPNRGHGFTHDGTRALFAARLADTNVTELWSRPIDGSAPATKLSGPMVAGGDVDDEPFLVTPDDSRVLYLADQDVDGSVELYVTWLGPAPKIARPPRPPVVR
ncbi:MAG: hypothetical protein ABL998_04005 [Planctomycetota bacterium]